jgi:hypothetical protein
MQFFDEGSPAFAIFARKRDFYGLDVAVGAALGIDDAPPAPDDEAGTSPPELRAAVPALLASSPNGWIAFAPGWLGLLLWRDDRVVDFTHVHAHAVASIGLYTPWHRYGSAGGDSLQPAPTPNGSGYVPPYVAWLAGETIATVVAYPRAADGTALAGSMDCVFASSDTSVLRVDSAGIVAHVTLAAPGTATLTTACFGLLATAQVEVVATPSPIGDAAIDAREAADATYDAHATDAGADHDASPDAGDGGQRDP